LSGRRAARTQLGILLYQRRATPSPGSTPKNKDLADSTPGIHGISWSVPSRVGVWMSACLQVNSDPAFSMSPGYAFGFPITAMTRDVGDPAQSRASNCHRERAAKPGAERSRSAKPSFTALCLRPSATRLPPPPIFRFLLQTKMLTPIDARVALAWRLGHPNPIPIGRGLQLLWHSGGFQRTWCS